MAVMLAIVHSMILVYIFLLCFYIFGRRNFKLFEKLDIPGPSPISHLGNLLELRKKGFAYVFKYWREIYGDIYGIFIGVRPYYIISDPEFIQEVLLKRFSNFTNRPVILGDKINNISIISAKDHHWKYLRTVLAPFFSSHHLRQMNTIIQACADVLVKNIGKSADSGEMAEVKMLFSAYTIDVIAATVFGIKLDSQKNPDDPLVQKAKDIFKFSFFQPLIFLTFLLPSTARFIEKSGLINSVIKKQIYLRKICKNLIEERKKTQINNDIKENILNLMIKAQINGHEKLTPAVEKELHLENVTDWRTKRGMTDDEILSQCVLFLLAGYETTASTLTFFTQLMATNPESQQKLYQEIIEILGKDLPTYDNVQQLPYLDMCADETLRMYPTGSGLERECKKTCTIKGVEIPKGLTVRVAVDALHHNSKYWPEPDKFIPERFSKEGKSKQVPFTYFPFGAGPRMCLGMRLAKLEFKISAVQMIRNFKILATEMTEDPPVLDDTLILTAKNGVWVKYERR